jgi:dihydropteroate synthase
VRLGARTYDDAARLVMGVVNATPDSFSGVGGVKAGLGPEVTPAQEIARIETLVGSVRTKHPEVAISIDTWRAEVAAELGASLVCTDTGGLTPRTYARGVRYADLLGEVRGFLVALASRRDFVGETPDLPVDERLEGTMATVTVCAWHGPRLFRVHDVRQARRTVDMVTSIIGDRPPAQVVRTLPQPKERGSWIPSSRSGSPGARGRSRAGASRSWWRRSRAGGCRSCSLRSTRRPRSGRSSPRSCR